MDLTVPQTLAQNPFAALSLVAAPALLTNTASVLAMSTINRTLRAGDRMRALSAEMDKGNVSPEKMEFLLTQVSRVEKQAVVLLRALHSIYVAIGCFASATIISVIGASLAPTHYHGRFKFAAVVGLLVGIVGAWGLVWGSANLLHATRISTRNIMDEASMIRKRSHHPTPLS